MPESSVKCIWPVEALLGEGPVWWSEAEALLFVDIKAPALCAWYRDGTRKIWPMPSEIGSVALRRNGGLVGALRTGLAFVSLPDLTIETFASPEASTPGNRFNDGKCDPQGRYWIASMDDAVQAPTGAIWRLDADRQVTHMADGHIVGNGFGWSPDGKQMYFTDSEARTIFVYDFDGANGSLGPRRPFATVSPEAGYPDGLCIDAQGGVWSAHWDGGRITRYHPDGQIDRVIMMPVPRPTSLAFGGPNLDKLYVTSARIGLDQNALIKAPLSGGLFELDVGLQGRPEPRFAG